MDEAENMVGNELGDEKLSIVSKIGLKLYSEKMSKYVVCCLPCFLPPPTALDRNMAQQYLNFIGYMVHAMGTQAKTLNNLNAYSIMG